MALFGLAIAAGIGSAILGTVAKKDEEERLAKAEETRKQQEKQRQEALKLDSELERIQQMQQYSNLTLDLTRQTQSARGNIFGGGF